MAAILRDIPLHDHFTAVQVRGRAYRIFPYQIVLWVSLSRPGQESLDPLSPRFPVVLDPGFTDNFLIHEQQLRELAGLQPIQLRRLPDALRAHGRQIPLHDADLWLHRNRPRERDTFANESPFLLALHRGIGLTSGADPFPRLPLLGARALRQAQARLVADYGRCRASLHTPRRFWFMNWW